MCVCSAVSSKICQANQRFECVGNVTEFVTSPRWCFRAFTPLSLCVTISEIMFVSAQYLVMFWRPPWLVFMATSRGDKSCLLKSTAFSFCLFWLQQRTSYSTSSKGPATPPPADMQPHLPPGLGQWRSRHRQTSGAEHYGAWRCSRVCRVWRAVCQKLQLLMWTTLLPVDCHARSDLWLLFSLCLSFCAIRNADLN